MKDALFFGINHLFEAMCCLPLVDPDMFQLCRGSIACGDRLALL